MFTELMASGSGGGGWTFELGEKESYTAPKTYSCNNAFFSICVKSGSSISGIQGIGYVDNGVLTWAFDPYNRFTSSTYSNGVLTLTGGHNADYSRIYIAYA